MCNCKYGCCAVCSDGTCWGVCCSAPACSTCGCGNCILSGETCLNKTYYLYGNVDGENIYYSFQFQYCLFVEDDASSSSVDDNIQTYMIWYYDAPSGMTLTTSSSDVDGYTNYNNTPYACSPNGASNSYFWESEIISGNYNSVFTPYDLSGCSSSFPDNGNCSSQ